uniref:FLYWCH-type domain-containing protein n=1 Tax=Meloidogyne hapla TaxID=6305 RepID=A0A1I8B6R7_MELHA
MAERIRNKLLQMTKRRRNDEAETEQVATETEQTEDDESNNESDEEQENVIELDVGYTQKGRLSLWYKCESYRYTDKSKNCKSWRCSDRQCSAKVKVLAIEGERARGILKGEHDHVGDPVGLEVEKRRKVFNERIQENPTVKTKKLADELRNGKNEDAELIVRSGTDNSIQIRAGRMRKKVIGCVTGKPLEMEIAPSLINKEGVNVLLYDSRKFRENDPDVTLVFAHPKVNISTINIDYWPFQRIFHYWPFRRFLGVGHYNGWPLQHHTNLFTY